MPLLNNTATITLKLDVVGEEELAALKTTFNTLKRWINALNSSKGAQGLVDSFSEMSSNVSNLEKKLEGVEGEQKDVAAATKKVSEAQDKVTKSVKDTVVEEKKLKISQEGVTYAIKQADSHVKAFLASEKRATLEAKKLKDQVAAVRVDSASVRNIKEMTDGLRLGSKEWKTFSETSKVAQKLLRDIGSSAGLTGDKLSRLRGRTKEVVVAFKDWRDEMKTLHGRLTFFEQQMDAIFRASFRMKMAGNDLKQFARGVLQAFVGLMGTFGDFEFMLNRAAGALSIWGDSTVGTLVGVDALQIGVLDLSEKMRLFPAKEVAEAMYFWGSTTGAAVESIGDLNREVSALEPVMKAAAMTNTSYETTIKGVYSILAQYYNGAVVFAKQVTEQLFYITQKTAAEFGDLINSFKMVGPIAAANNVSFQEMVVLFGRLADLGIRGTMAGRAFRQMFIQLVRPAPKAIAAINSLFQTVRHSIEEFKGKSYYELVFPEGKFVGTEKYIKYLALATRDLTQARRNAFLAQITTANELPVLTALILQEQRELSRAKAGWSQYGSQLDKTSQMAADASEYFRKNWSRLENSWKGVVGALTRGWDALKMSVGGAVADAFTPFIDQIREVVKTLRMWVEANPEVVRAVAQVVAAIALLSAAIGTVLVVLGGLMGLAAVFKVIINSFRPFFGVISIGLTAIVGLAEAVVRNFEYIQKRVQEAMKVFQGSMGDGSVAAANLIEILKKVTEPIQHIFDTVVRVVADAVLVFAELASTLGGFDSVTEVLKGLAEVLGLVIAAKAVARVYAMVKAWVVLSRLWLGLRAAATALLAAGAAIRLVGAQTSGVVSMTAATGKLSTSLRLLGSAMLGPLAIIAGGLGFVAYEKDIGGFRGFIDGITDNFRDLGREIAEISDKFGSFGLTVKHTAELMAAALVPDKIQQTSYMDLIHGETKLWLDSMGAGHESIETAAEANKAAREKFVVDTMTGWESALARVNQSLAESGKTYQFSLEQFAQKMLVFDTFGGGDLSATIAERVMKELDPAATRAQVAEYWKTAIVSSGREYDTKLSDYIPLPAFEAEVYNVELEKAAKEAASHVDADAILLPFIDSITKQLSDDPGNSARILRDAFEKPILNGLNLAELLNSGKVSESTNEAIKGLFANLTPYAEEGAEELATSIMTNFKEVIDTVTEGMKTIGGDSVNTMWEEFRKRLSPKDVLKGLTENALSKQAYEMLTSGDPYWAKRTANLLAADLETIKARLNEEIASSSDRRGWAASFSLWFEKAPQALRDAYSEWSHAASEILSEEGIEGDKTQIGMSAAVFGPFKEGFDTAGAKLVRDAKSAAEKAAEDIAAAGPKAAKDILAAILDTFAPTDFKKNVIAALKNRNSISKGIGSKFKELFDKDLWRAFRSGDTRANLEAELWVMDISTKLTSALAHLEMTDDTTALDNLRKQVATFLKNGIPAGAPPEVVSEIKTLVAQLWGDGTHGTPPITLPVPEIIVPDLPKPDSKNTWADYYADLKETLGITIPKPKVEPFTRTDFEGAYGPVEQGFSALQTQATTTGNAISTNLATGIIASSALPINDAANVAGSVLESFTNLDESMSLVGTNFMSTIASSVTAAAKLGSGKSPVDAANLVAGSLKSSLLISGYTAGSNLMLTFGNGIMDSAWYPRAKAWAMLNSIKEILFGDSPPPKGPLRNLDKGAESVGQAYGDSLGLRAKSAVMGHMRELRAEMASESYAARLENMGGTEVNYNNKREVLVTIDVSSKDGSVSRATQAQVRRGAMDAFVLADLQHMITVE